MHTFSKVCISLQSVHLAEKLHTFLTFYRLSCTLFADFFWCFAQVLHTLNDVKSTFMHTFCRLSFFLIQAVQTLMSLHAYQFCALQTFCRHCAYIKQSKCVSLKCSSATGVGPSALSTRAKEPRWIGRHRRRFLRPCGRCGGHYKWNKKQKT